MIITINYVKTCVWDKVCIWFTHVSTRITQLSTSVVQHRVPSSYYSCRLLPTLAPTSSQVTTCPFLNTNERMNEKQGGRMRLTNMETKWKVRDKTGNDMNVYGEAHGIVWEGDLCLRVRVGGEERQHSNPQGCMRHTDNLTYYFDGDKWPDMTLLIRCGGDLSW